MARKLIVELIGTFFLVFTIGLVVIAPGAGDLAPLAIGAALTAVIFAGGHISGAHYNPAVTVAVLLRGRTTFAEGAGYWAAQIIGAVLAALAVGVLKGDAVIVAMQPAAGPALLAEFLFTFALAFVILNVATAKGTEGNSHYGLAIGFTVVAGAYAVGGISGGAFNPAVAIAITMLGLVDAGSIWIYLVANFAGGIAAAVVFNALDLGDDKPTSATPAEQAGLRAQAEPGR
jgi:aquaporin Z